MRTNLEYEKQLKATLTPYLLQTYPEIILERENNTISVRARGGEDLGEMSIDDFIQKLQNVVDEKK